MNGSFWKTAVNPKPSFLWKCRNQHMLLLILSDSHLASRHLNGLQRTITHFKYAYMLFTHRQYSLGSNVRFPREKETTFTKE